MVKTWTCIWKYWRHSITDSEEVRKLRSQTPCMNCPCDGGDGTVTAGSLVGKEVSEDRSDCREVSLATKTTILTRVCEELSVET